MRLRIISAVLLVTISVSVSAGPIPPQVDPADRWYTVLNFAWNASGEHGVSGCLNALALAPDAEHEADTLLYLARAYEHAMDRSKAVATYKRIIEEHPSSGHLPRVYFRLGELHTSVTLVPGSASEQRRDAVRKEMTKEKCVGYFEAAIATGPPWNSWVRASRMYLAGIYDKEKGLEILHEIANLDTYDVKEPDYTGPYLEHNDPRNTLGERLDSARLEAATARRNARRRLVLRSIIHRDPVQSIANLRTLIERYPDSDISSMALEKIEKLSKKMLDEMTGDAAPPEDLEPSLDD